MRLTDEEDRALTRVWDEVRFLSPDSGIRVLEQALQELKDAAERYHRALRG